MRAFHALLDKARAQGSGLLVLLDPDKGRPQDLAETAAVCQKAGVDGLLLGGSLVAADGLDDHASAIQAACDLPLWLFPGGGYQLTRHADGLLFLSLLSGRNPHYLVGEQVIAAPRVKALGIETVGTAYLLIESGATTSVGFISGTPPIPRAKPDLAVAHALAAEMMGFGCLYLEAGSGAELPVPVETVHAVRKHVGLPLIVGGGLRTPEAVAERAKAGADFIVTGTVVEERGDASLLTALAAAAHWKPPA